MIRTTRSLVVAAFVFSFSARAHAQACTPEWSDAFASGAGYGCMAFTTWDADGAGPGPELLYLGRNNGLDSWDGTVRTQVTWLTMTAFPFSGEIRAMTPFDPDGAGPLPEELVIGGAFESVQTTTAANIARWDGTSWSTLGSGANNRVFALKVYDEDGPGPNPARLFAAGEFTAIGGVTARGIARWDGTSWTVVGAAGFGSIFVNALETWDADGPGPTLPVLAACGWFSSLGGTSANNISRWNGTSWSAFGGGLTPNVSAMVEFDDDGAGPNPPRLYAAGTSGLSYWGGASWVGAGTPAGNFYSLLVHDEDGPGPLPTALFGSGEFTSVSGVPANAIARRSGGTWSALGTGLTSDFPPIQGLCLASYDEDGAGPMPSRMFVGGGFKLAGGKPANGFARWDGAAWDCTQRGLEEAGRAIAAVDLDGAGPGAASLYVGGNFLLAHDVSAPGIARWTGTDWSALGGGLTRTDGFRATVEAIAEFDEDGTGPNPPGLFAAGSFDLAGGSAVSNIARWDGSSWSDVGGGITGGAMALAVFDEDGAGPGQPALFLGGFLSNAGGTPVSGIARWNGTSWSAVSSGVAGTVNALHVADLGSGPSLYAGGLFASPGARIARWNGTSWSALLTGLNGGIGGPVVYSLHAADLDGAGPAPKLLYVGGRFATAGAASSKSVAAWNGTSWSGLGAGVGDGSGFVYSLAAFDPTGSGGASDLYAGGAFLHTLGGGFYWNLARWNGTAWVAAPSLLGVGGFIGAESMSVFDEDGIGPVRPGLFITGDFTTLDGVSSERMALLRCESSAPSTDFCFPGTGGVIPCPCGQPANPAGGCANFGATATSGAVLAASGLASLASDTVLLTTSNHRTAPAAGILNVFFTGQGALTSGTASNAGVRCVNTSLKRLYTGNTASGMLVKPSIGNPSVSARSAALGVTISPGETRHYFNVYRDSGAATPCGSTSATTNLTNGTSISWGP